MTNCKHRADSRYTIDRGFCGCVAEAQYCNPASHGWITQEVRCRDCGAQRLINRNGGHEERGGWSEATAEDTSSEQLCGAEVSR